MRKWAVKFVCGYLLLPALGMLLGGCGRTMNSSDESNRIPANEGGEAAANGNESDVSNREEEITECTETEEDGLNRTNGILMKATGGIQPDAFAGSNLAQGGPYGEISIMLPECWDYELCPTDSDALLNGAYGIHFWPGTATEGFIELAWADWFGVCGTGLAQENKVIAGVEASIGTYDEHSYWDFVRFKGQKEGVVALSCLVESWWDEYGEKVTEILDTLQFDPDTKEGGIFVYEQASENTDIGLYFSLKKISSTGVTLVYNQYDSELPSGQLQDGDDFVLEQDRDGQWEEVPVAVEGDYGFHSVAYTIPNDTITERELDWKWLYGELPPGKYRIGKQILDFRKAADYDSYMVYAVFFLNEEAL